MKQVIVVRRDLNMSPGKLAAQVAHASLGAFRRIGKRSSHLINDWDNQGQTKVVLMIENEAQLMDLLSQIKRDRSTINKHWHLVKDEGRTELKGENFTCLGIGPAPTDVIDKYTKELKLYRC